MQLRVIGPLWSSLAMVCTPWGAHAQSSPSGSTPSEPAPQRVEIQAPAADSDELRRRSTAAKIVVGREEIERMGDSNLADILKRLPGISVGGRAGRGGPPRMRGLGNGYTQILVDGERLPRGFSLDAIEPDQIERIEIMRAPTAETGARAIAGTINIVLREDFQRRMNDLRLTHAVEQGRPRTIASWIYADQRPGLDYQVTISARRQDTRDESRAWTQWWDPQGHPEAEHLDFSRSSSHTDAGFISSRLRWQLGRSRLELQPYVSVSGTRTSSQSTLQSVFGQQPEPYSLGQGSVNTRNTLARLGGAWMGLDESGGRWILRLGSSLAQTTSNSQGSQSDAQGGVLRDKREHLQRQDVSLNQSGRYARLVAEQHSLVAGWELQLQRRQDERNATTNGQAELLEFGDNVQAATSRVALYIQDDWNPSPQWAFNAGLRWEGLQTRSSAASYRVSNDSAVLTPLFHAVWRFPHRPRDQLRLSLTRSYRSPSTAQLIARPAVSARYPVAGPNEPLSPDRAGNPQLKPEIARGLDLALEHYLPGSGLFSANLYLRHIEDLIRDVRTQEAVSWSPVPRWVLRPQNIGGAWVSGLELEAKFRPVDLGGPDWPLSVRLNATLMNSRVEQVMGPDNRLDQQPRFLLNVGADYTARLIPWTWGAHWNHTPAYGVRQMDNQRLEQGMKRVVDVYALWRVSGPTRLRFSVSNALPLDDVSATTVSLENSAAQRRQQQARTYRLFTARLETRF